MSAHSHLSGLNRIRKSYDHEPDRCRGVRPDACKFPITRPESKKRQVSAVSTKRHTTRENTLGVMTAGRTQVFFHDTPGFVSHEDRDDYKPALSAASREAIASVNLTLLLVDASKDVTKRGLRSLMGLLERALRSSAVGQARSLATSGPISGSPGVYMWPGGGRTPAVEIGIVRPSSGAQPKSRSVVLHHSLVSHRTH